MLAHKIEAPSDLAGRLIMLVFFVSNPIRSRPFCLHHGGFVAQARYGLDRLAKHRASVG